MTITAIEPIDPAATALLVMDYQHLTVGRLPDAGELLSRARTAIDLLRSHGITIGYVRIAFADGEAPAGTMGKRATAEQLAMLHADAPGTQIHGQVEPAEEDIVVRKVRVGPFSTTDLHQRLQDRGIDTLVLAGISTSGVVLSAVREGFDRDYRLIVLADLTFDPEPDVQEFLISQLLPKQADVIAAGDLPGLLPQVRAE